MITINITIAVFAVNFSFLSYQFSPYKGVLTQLSIKHIGFAIITLLLSLSPLISIVLSQQWVPTIALINAPLITYFSIILSRISTKETSPDFLIRKKVNKFAIGKFINLFSKEENFIESRPPEFEEKEKKRTPPPFHEMKWKPVANIPPDDPFGFLQLMAIASIEHRDLNTFESIVDCGINSIAILDEIILKKQEKEKKLIPEIVRGYPILQIVNAGLYTCNVKECEIFTERYFNKVGIFLSKKQVYNRFDIELVLLFLNGMFLMAKDMLVINNPTCALIPIIVTRHLITRGLRIENNDKLDDLTVKNGYVKCVELIQNIGEKAIELKDTDFLYRCLDALGWLGCSAVKHDEPMVGNCCANALVQLGRISRVKGLECFWDRCALSPTDHAWERIEWMVTWTVHLHDKSRERWSETLSEALSRLEGKECNIEYIKEEEKWKYFIKKSEEPYIFTIDDNGRLRKIDYSDNNVLKQFNLY